MRKIRTFLTFSQRPSMTRLTAANGTLCERCFVARSGFARTKGLLGRSELPAGEGILLLRERAIHTFFMRFPIDVLFVDADLRVLAVVPGLKPWRTASCRRARAVLELPAGSAPTTLVGEQLAADPPLPRVPGPPSDTLVALVAAALAAICLVRFNHLGTAAVSAFFAVALVSLSAVDIRERRLPNRMVIPAALVVLVGREAAQSSRWLEWLLGALAAFGVLLAVHLIAPKALAMGDVKLALLLGAGLGYHVAQGVMLGFILAAFWAVGLLLRGGLKARHDTFALGPFLSLGAIVVLLVLR